MLTVARLAAVLAIGVAFTNGFTAAPGMYLQRPRLGTFVLRSALKRENVVLGASDKRETDRVLVGERRDKES